MGVRLRQAASMEHAGTSALQSDEEVARPGFVTALRRDRAASVAAAFLLLMAVVAILAPIISPESYTGYAVHHAGAHPQLGWRYFLGADVEGHSILMYVILGARTTLGIAALATVVSLLLGGIPGLCAGRYRGWVDAAVMFVVDGGLLIPALPLLLILTAFGSAANPWIIGLIFGLIGAFIVAKVLRNAAAKLPANRPGLALLRDLRRPIVLCATYLLAGFVVTEATVDFLGYGLPASNPSWGNALATVTDYFDAGFWWWALFPGLAIFLTVLAVNVLGRCLMQAFTTADANPDDLTA